MAINITTLVMGVGGGVLVYSAVKGVYPSDVIRNALSGTKVRYFNGGGVDANGLSKTDTGKVNTSPSQPSTNAPASPYWNKIPKPSGYSSGGVVTSV